MTGSSGLIGSAFCSKPNSKNLHIVRLVRRASPGTNEIYWNPGLGILDGSSLEGVDAVIHLAGESIASGRWTSEKMKRIRESRIKGTGLLSETLARLSNPPKVFVSVSAIGFYGDRGDERLSETSSAGEGFLAQVCQEWESATAPAIEKGIRVVNPRVGMVLSASGGALAQMLPIYRLGVGGRLGKGHQYMSWIAIDDMVNIIHFAIQNESLNGAVNAVSPNPVPNSVFSKALAKVLSRPNLFALPAFAARFVWGQMADEVLLSSSRAYPDRLEESGFKFAFPKLEDALRQILERPASLNK
jgi:uncharacterized protein (TIGR01777 family)